MKLKAITALILSLGFAASVQAGTKVAEYGDPVIGNDYNNCSFTRTFGTGGGSFLYDEYEVVCPNIGTYTVGVQMNYDPYNYHISRRCTFTTGSSGYYVRGNCDNWIIYEN